MTNSIQATTLYVDGACRGNPGIGGWGALIIEPTGERREIFGGELDTTNNRMELSAAMEGILACPVEQSLIIYTDSSYVQKGITEWIKGWKAKDWKGVKNPDLWKKLDQVCVGRKIEWNWIKGHAGHEGNERADYLANLGADAVTKKKPLNGENTTKQDWLLDDPFGLDVTEDDEYDDFDSEQNLEENSVEVTIGSDEPSNIIENALVENHEAPLDPYLKQHIKITPMSNEQQGERLLILDTETTGFYYQSTDRVIEVGAIEMINRKLTGSSIHIYMNPKKLVGESENIHGISDEFLADKPEFNQIASVLYDYLKGAKIVAHNATFDMNFLDMEFEKAGFAKLSHVCSVTDTLAIAKRKHPGQKNSLDALVRRYDIPARDRTFHGALLDAEILADVYLAMTGGQVSLDIDQNAAQSEQDARDHAMNMQPVLTPLITPQAIELQAHQEWLEKYQQKHNQPALFAQVPKS